MAAVTIYGIQEAQDAMLRAAEALEPGGALDEAVKEATLVLHRYAVSITDVRSGALRASHYVELRGSRGAVYISPSATRSDGGRPAEYGIYEHARGGRHAFYARTLAEAGQRASQAAWSVLQRALP